MEELSELIHRLHSSAGESDGERRQAPRVSRSGTLDIRVALDGKKTRTISVRFRDCSSTGIGFSHSNSMEISTRFEVVIKHPTRGDQVLRYEVVRCQKMAKGSYNIGARILRDITN